MYISKQVEGAVMVARVFDVVRLLATFIGIIINMSDTLNHSLSESRFMLITMIYW